MKFKCDLEAIREYREYIRKIYRNQKSAFSRLKRKCEAAEWHDQVYVSVISELNEVGDVIAAAFAELTDGNRVRLIDELIPALERYLETKSDYRI